MFVPVNPVILIDPDPGKRLEIVIYAKPAPDRDSKEIFIKKRHSPEGMPYISEVGN